MESDEQSESRRSKWARIDDYLLSLRRRRRPPITRKPRTQPEDPRAMLSTVPFVALIIALALLALAIAIIAMPGQEWSQPAERPAPEPELGKAPPGWLERSKEERR